MSNLPTPLVVALAALTLLRVCGSDEEEVDVTVEGAPMETAVAGEASGEAPEVQGGVVVIPPSEPAHGGTVVMAEDRPVEVVVGPGEVEAYLRGPEAEAEAGPGTVITVDLPGADGEVHTVPMVWQPAQRRYYAAVEQVQPRPGPVVVRVVHGGRARVGRAPRVVILPRARWRSPRRHRVVIHNGRWVHPSARGVRVRGGRPGRPDVNVHVRGKRPPHPGRPNVNVHIHGPRPPHPPHPGRPNVNIHIGGGGHGPRGHRGHPGRGRGVRINRRGGHPGRGHGHGGGHGRGHGRRH